MAAPPQTTFSGALSWNKICVLWLECQWSLFLRVQLTMSLNRRQAITQTNDDPVSWRICVSSGLRESEQPWPFITYDKFRRVFGKNTFVFRFKLLAFYKFIPMFTENSPLAWTVLGCLQGGKSSAKPVGHQVISCRFGATPLPEPMLTYCQLDTQKKTYFDEVWLQTKKIYLELSSAKYRPFGPGTCLWQIW